MLQGIDVSDYQGIIDWKKVAAAGIAFAFAKATEGTDFTAERFAADWQGIRAAGMVRGAYCFGRPSAGSGHDDAAYFLAALEAVGGVQQGDLVALDFEDDRVAADADLLAYVVDWAQTVSTATGCVIVLYSTYPYLAAHRCLGAPELAAYPRWIAAYQLTPPATPKSEPLPLFWQHTDGLSVPGIAGLCDGDWYFGLLPSLLALGKPAPVAVAVGAPDGLAENPQSGENQAG